MKELSEEKDTKMKEKEKQLMKIQLAYEELNKNNPTEEIYRLRLNLEQSNKNYEELKGKHIRIEEEITKYK